MVKKKRNGPKLGSVDAFWIEHPKLLLSKQIFDATIELFLLLRAFKSWEADKDKTCEGAVWNDNFDMERIRVCLQLMCFIHVLHLFRLIFTVVRKFNRRAQSGACSGCIKCLLIDCYCCVGTVVYLYV